MSNKASNFYLTLHNGLEIPALAFGTGSPPDQIPLTKQAVIDAVKAGYRHIDTGWRYNTEHLIGEALQELFQDGVVTRDELFITTKVPPQFARNPEVALQQSLERLQLDYVDLLLQHWPLAWLAGKDNYPVPVDTSKNSDLKENDFKLDPESNYLDAYLAMESLYLDQTGRVKSLGVSNYPVSYLKELLSSARVKPVVNQIELHPHLSQPKLVEFLEKNDIIPFAYAPLGMDGAPNLKLQVVVDLAHKYNVSPGSVLLNYHLQAGRGVVARSIKKKNIVDNLTYVPLTDEELSKLDEFGVTHAKRFNDKFINFKDLFDNY